MIKRHPCRISRHRRWTRLIIGKDGVRLIELVHLGAEGAPLDFEVLDVFLEGGAAGLASGGIFFEFGEGGEAVFDLGLEDAEGGEEGRVQAARVVGAVHDVLSERLALGMVAGEERGMRALLEDVGELPGEVVRVLDAGV